MKVQRDGRNVTVEVTTDAEELVSHAGSALLAQVADKTGLTRALSRELGGLHQRGGGHDPGRVLRDPTVMLGDGGDCLADLRAVRDATKRRCSGRSLRTRRPSGPSTRSPATPAGWSAYAQCIAGRASGRGSSAAGQLTIDLDATLLGSHSDNEGAAGTFKGGFGFHPMLAYDDETGEALGGELRPGKRRPEHRHRSDRRGRGGAGPDPRRARRDDDILLRDQPLSTGAGELHRPSTTARSSRASANPPRCKPPLCNC